MKNVNYLKINFMLFWLQNKSDTTGLNAITFSYLMPIVQLIGKFCLSTFTVYISKVIHILIAEYV